MSAMNQVCCMVRRSALLSRIHFRGKHQSSKRQPDIVSSFGYASPDVEESAETRVRITTPQRMDDNIRRRLLSRQLQEAETERRRRLGTPIIACSRPAYNLYKGRQTLSKSTPLTTLASHGWKHSRSKADSFTINAFSNRSFYYSSEESADKDKMTCEFDKLPISSVIVKHLHDSFDIKQATNIQEMVIPRLLSGSSVQFASENGSGKTLAYVIPLMEIAIRERWDLSDSRQIRAVILAPSRELVRQIAGVISQLSAETGFLRPEVFLDNVATPTVSGANGGFNALIATPSYFLRHFSGDLHSLRCIVIDEADTLLDDSFAEAVESVFRKIPAAQDHPEASENRSLQMILASATMPTALHEVVGRFFPAGDLVSLHTNRLHRLAAHVSHKFIRCSPSQKTDLIVNLARKVTERRSPTIIFCNRTNAVSFLVKFLIENGLPAEEVAALDGRLLVQERDAQWDAFTAGKKSLLIATDVASRGLDTPNLRHVVNFDMPRAMSDYIHRAGRLGRVTPKINQTKTGGGYMVTSFAAYPSDVELVWQLESAARRSATGSPQPLPEVDANIKRQLKRVAEQREAKHLFTEQGEQQQSISEMEPPFPRKFLGEEDASEAFPGRH